MRQGYMKLKKGILNPILIMYVMLVVSYFSQISFLHGYLGIIRRLILVWGIILIGYSALKNHQIYKNKFSFVLALFCAFSCISVLVNYSGRFFYGVVTMAYVCIFLFIFFNATRWDEETKKNKESIVNNVLNINIIFSFIFAVVAMVMYVLNINGAYGSGDNIVYFGMRENRLWGVYNSNTAATICIISTVSSFIQLSKSKKRGFLIANIVIQIIYLILTQSRTGWILIMVFATLYLFFNRVLPAFKEGKKIGIKLLNIVCSVGIVWVIAITPTFAKEILVKIPQTVISIIEMVSPDSSGIFDSEVSLDRVDEDFLEEQDVANGRSELWSAGLKIVKDNPIFGIGSENINEEAKPYLSEDRYQNLVKGGFHNSYLAILVSSGIIGLAIFAVFILMLVYGGFKYLWKNGNGKYSLIIMLLFTLMVNELMEARWLYNTSYLNIIFWVLAGFVIDKFEGAKEK